MRDFKYRALVVGKPAGWDSMKAPRSESLRPIAEAFKANLERAQTFTFAPAEISFLVRRNRTWAIYAIFKITGKVSPDLRIGIEERHGKEFQKQVDVLVKEFDSLPESEVDKLRGEFGVSYIEKLLKNSEGMQLTMEAVLSSLILSYWTTFESLAPDLWKAAVNNGPAILAQRVNLAMQDKPDSKITEHWKDKLQHDPRQDYAGSLIETGRVSFRRLDKIIYWYSVTFEGAARQIFKDNRDINALAAYRNALIHNSGKADKDFIKQVECVPDLRGKFNENQELLLDGEFVRRLRDALATIGEKLIDLADDLIAPQSP